jgi:hypothetical protein
MLSIREDWNEVPIDVLDVNTMRVIIIQLELLLLSYREQHYSYTTA